jgi:hypothetical protein
MAKVVADRVLETSTTTGAGALTLAGLVLGHQSFGAGSPPLMVNGDTCDYFAAEVDASGTPTGSWETGLGTWGTGNILTTSVVYASSNAGTKVSWAAGTKRIGLGLTVAGLNAAIAAPSNSEDVRLFGDGSDGAVTISSGTTVLSREMYYTNLTISGTGSLDPNGFRVLGTGILDLTNAPANAIQRNGGSGFTAITKAAGLAPVRVSNNSAVLMAAFNGGAGAAATSNAPVAGTALSYAGNYLLGGVAGRGGGTAAGSGSSAGAAGTENLNYSRFVERTFLNNSSGGFRVGSGDGAGASGGGNGTAGTGGGSGGTGQGGGAIAIFFKTISRGASTAVGCISSNGGDSGGGGAPFASGGAAGAGSGGAGAGFIQILYLTLTGTTATNAIQANGGNGGAGGADSFSTNRGAGGGEGGRGGAIVVFNATTKIYTVVDGIANSRTAPGVVTGTNVGGTAGTGALCQVNL